MSNDDELAAARRARAAERTGELVWRLPLHAEYAEMIKGRYADLTNAPERREARPITAAEFLHHFAGDVPWAHLDIAGTAWDARPAVRRQGRHRATACACWWSSRARTRRAGASTGARWTSTSPPTTS